MKVNIFVISLLLGVLGMITITQAIEVVYTGDSCDCPKNLNYRVNVPPPPKTYPNNPSEYGYKLDVPMEAKAKVTYSFDFTVQEPKIPPPTEQEKLNLYAKVDRITAHKKDCYASSKPSYNNCDCHHCTNLRSYSDRYVSPEAPRAIRNIRIFKHPNSISKSEPNTSKLLAIFLQPLDQPENIQMKSRSKRDISRIFFPGTNSNKVKRQERLIKQYNKRLQSRTEQPKLFAKKTSLPSKTATPKNRRPFEKLQNLLVPHRLRSKRDIKGEYDLIEKDRDQLDLTLPEIIQFMPETLNPNFKRGQCQFSQFNNALQDQTLERIPAIESINITKDNTKETLDNMESKSNDSTGESENEISSTHKKRNAADYGCGLNLNTYNHHLVIPAPTPGYSFEPYAPHSIIPNHYARSRPFTVIGSSFGIDPAPQQFVGAPYHEPIVGAVYKHHNQPATNPQLDKIISDIVNRHSDFIEASTHPGGALVDTTNEQEYQNKALLKNLWDGHWKKLFYEEPLHDTYPYMQYYRAPAPY